MFVSFSNVRPSVTLGNTPAKSCGMLELTSLRAREETVTVAVAMEALIDEEELVEEEEADALLLLPLALAEVLTKDTFWNNPSMKW
jgi:hypothetical protein